MTVIYATKVDTLGRSPKEKRKKENVVSQKLLFFAVEKEYGIIEDHLVLAQEENRKPYFHGYPVHFNYSHSGQYVVVALSATPVGVDVEHREREVTPRLLQRILGIGLLQPNEVVGLSPINVWTRYEAAFKIGVKPPLTRYFCEYDLDGHIISVCSEKDAFCDNVVLVEFEK